MDNTKGRQFSGHSRGGLSRLWRDLMLTTALATTMAACSGNPKPQTRPELPENKADVTQTVPAPPEKPPETRPEAQPEEAKGTVLVITDSMTITARPPATSVSVAEAARRDRINRTLLQDAQRNFLRLAALARTDYSVQLDSAETALSSYLVARDTTVHNRVAVLDPAQYDVGIALGFTPEQTVARMLRSERVPPTPEMLTLTVGKMATGYDPRTGFFTYTQDPAAITNLSGPKAEVCVIVPSSDHAVVADIARLTRAQQVRFANRHEEWHCLDSKYVLRHIPRAALDSLPNGKLADFPDNMVLMEVFANGYNKEALADVGAAGDLIRHEGFNLSLITTVARWRAGYPGDIQHLSTPVLAGFLGRIEAMGGLEAFRALDDEAAKALYFAVVDEFGMTPRSIQANIKIEKAGLLERLDWAERARTDPEIAKAFDFMRYYMRPTTNQRPSGPLSPGEQAVADAVSDWNAFAQLEDKAFELRGRITPATLVQAYGVLRTELRAEMLRDPENGLPALKMAALQESFSWQVQETDYVEANELRGVDITRAERSVRRFSARAATKTPTPQHP